MLKKPFRPETLQKEGAPAKGISARRWRPSFLTWVIVIVATGALVAGLYPTAAGWLTSYNQAQVVDAYATQVEQAEPDAATQLALAHQYNDALTYGVLVSSDSNIPVGKEDAAEVPFDYWSMLTAGEGELMSRIRISKIDVDLPIYHGTSDEVLDEGAGHLQGSHLPVGGSGTRTVITAHRGLPNAVMFNNLGNLKEGDTFTLETFGEMLTYEVVDTQVIEPDQTDAIRAQEGRDLATLITCTPLGLNTHRILVTGERVQPTPQEDLDTAGQPSDLPRFPWWILALVAGLTLIGLYLRRQGRKDAAVAAIRAARAKEAQTGGDKPKAQNLPS